MNDLFGKRQKYSDLNLRIPYMGSKRKIATQLMDKMLEIKPKAKYFYDLFGGGGVMSFNALEWGLKVYYNEKQKGLVDLLNYIIERTKNKQFGKYGLFPDDFYNFITREEFRILKNEDSLKGQFARICYSFGSGQKNYLFGDIEELKHLAHNIVVFRCGNSLKEFNKKTNFNLTFSDRKNWNDRRLDFMSQIKQRTKFKKLEQLERLQQLERLEQLEQLQQLEQLPVFSITNLDFRNVKIETPIQETIVYLDPPYRGTTSYLEKDVLHQNIDDFFLNSPYSCFMSEYNAPFKSILEIRKESLFNNANIKERKFVLEKLYWNKK